MQEEAGIRLEKRDQLATITLCRPSKLNALDERMLGALLSALNDVGDDRGTRAVVITGMGEKAFSAGADIEVLSRATPLEVRELARRATAVGRTIESLGKPVIAALNGLALGGGLEIAEACSLRIAVSGAQLGHPEVKIGAVAGWGGTTRLPRLIGRGRAAELLLTGRPVLAEQALEWGLVNQVVQRGKLLPAATRLAEELASRAPVAVELSWQALLRGLDVSLEESLEIGADAFGLVAATEDFRKGTAAFLEGRQAEYDGK